jgi:cell division septal protein FtsQ
VHKSTRPQTKRPITAPKPRSNRKRRTWHGLIRRVCVLVGILEILLFLFSSPSLWVTKVRVEGMRTISAQQVFNEVNVPTHANLLIATMRAPFGSRLANDTVIDHISRSFELPHTLIIRVVERQPYVTLSENGLLWLVDNKGVPYRFAEKPPAGVPVLEFQGILPPNSLHVGKPITADWLLSSYKLMALLSDKNNLTAASIKVDQNSNICLNRVDNLQIKLGQSDQLPEKLALAQATINAGGNDIAQRVAYIDVSSPDQPALMPRSAVRNREAKNGTFTSAQTEWNHAAE